MNRIYKTRKARKTLKSSSNKLEIMKKISENGKIFSVIFTKKDGTERKMTCRLGVKRYLSGGENPVRHIPKYLTVYDIQTKGYRNINFDTLKGAKGNGQEFCF